jgi:hypothetical protein
MVNGLYAFGGILGQALSRKFIASCPFDSDCINGGIWGLSASI